MNEPELRPTLAEMLRATFEAKLAGVHTALPAKVEKWDRENQTVDVSPLVNLVQSAEGGMIEEPRPVIPNVPLVFPRAGGMFVSFPVAVGDTVLLVFCEDSLDEWRAKGTAASPGDLRRHSLSDAVAIPGLYAAPDRMSPAPHAENLVLGFDEGQIHVKPDGEVHLGEEDPSEFVALAASTKSEISAVRDTLNSLVTAFNAHTHVLTLSAGTGTAAPPAPPASAPAPVGEIAAEKVKAK